MLKTAERMSRAADLVEAATSVSLYGAEDRWLSCAREGTRPKSCESKGPRRCDEDFRVTGRAPRNCAGAFLLPAAPRHLSRDPKPCTAIAMHVEYTRSGHGEQGSLG
ncbi:MAG TPA: hypothetical protein VIP55_03675, partial [Agromyces sp.]